MFVSFEINSIIYFGSTFPHSSPLGLLFCFPLLSVPLSTGPWGAPPPHLSGTDTRQQVRSQSSGPSSTTDLGPGKSPLSLGASVLICKMGTAGPPPEFPLSCDGFWLKPQFLILTTKKFILISSPPHSHFSRFATSEFFFPFFLLPYI